MASPFKLFRKHQKAMLAVLGLLAMISFVVLPIVLKMLSAPGGRTDPVAASTARYGDLHESRINQLFLNRSIVRRFLEGVARAAALESGERYPAAAQMADRIGLPGEEQVVDTWLMVRRAEELGLVVSDDAINQILIGLTTAQGVTQERVNGILADMRVSQRQLFSLLRHELLALRLQELFLLSLGASTPAERWDHYQRLNLKAALELVPIEVSEFAGDVADPGDAELEAFFDKHKTALPDPASPEPGFRIPKQIAFEYIKGNYDKLANPATVPDEEVRAYYEQNKETLFRRETLTELEEDESSPGEPAESGGADERPDQSEMPEEPTDSETDAETPQDSGASGGPSDAGDDVGTGTMPEVEVSPTDEPSGAKPSDRADEAGAEADVEPSDDGSSSEPSAAAPGGRLQGSAAAPSLFRLTAFWQDSAEQSADGPPPPEQQEPAEQSEPIRAGADSAAQAPEEVPSPEPSAEEEMQSIVDQIAGEPKSDYMTLEEVEDQIRRQLAQKRAQAVLDRLRDRLQAFHDDQWMKYEGDGEPPQKPDLRALAEQVSKEEPLPAGVFSVYQTGLIPKWEAQQLDIGGSGVNRPGDFADSMYGSVLPYKPQMAQDTRGDYYLFWKLELEGLEETEQRIPEFEEVRPIVLAKWREIQARQIARRHAEELAARAREANKPLADALPGMTVIDTEPFTWINNPLVPYLWNPRPEISEITRKIGPGQSDVDPEDAVAVPGAEFMRAVFQPEQDRGDIQVGSVGVALNQPKTMVYVYRIADLSPSLEVLRQQFFRENYDRYRNVSQTEVAEAYRSWRDQLRASVGFQWERPPRGDERG